MAHGEEICKICYEDKYLCGHFDPASGDYNPNGAEREAGERAGGVDPEAQEIDTEFVVDETTNAEYLQAIYSAYCIADTYNPTTKADNDRIQRIKKKSLRLADKILSDIYNEFFDKDESEED